MTNEIRKGKNVQVDGVLLTLFIAIAVLLSALIVKTAAVRIEKKRTVKPDTKVEEVTDKEPFKREVKTEEYVAPKSDEPDKNVPETQPETLPSNNTYSGNNTRNGGNIGVNPGGNNNYNGNTNNNSNQGTGNNNGGQTQNPNPEPTPDPTPEPTPEPTPDPNPNPAN